MSTGSGYSWGTGTGHSIPYHEFWQPMADALSARGWGAVPVSDFPVAVVKPNYWLCGMIDGHRKNVDGALGELFAATHPLNFPNYRLLVVVFQKVSKQEEERICHQYLGTRMEKQAIASVIQLESGQFFPPPWKMTDGHSYPMYYPDVGHDIEGALRQVRSPH